MHTGFPAWVGTEICLPPIMALMLACPQAEYRAIKAGSMCGFTAGTLGPVAAAAAAGGARGAAFATAGAAAARPRVLGQPTSLYQ